MLACRIAKDLGSFRLHVNLEVKDHVVALFGPSGSGKSMTLQCIAGLVTPDAGRIEIGGRVVFDSGTGVNLPPERRNVGYVFQNYALFPHMTVAGNVAYGLHRLPRQEREARVRQVLRAVRLEGLERRRPHELSGGQQQRVALARALVTRPAALLLDEPFAALDSIIRSRLHRELLELLQELPIPTLLVTHNLEEAYALSREIAVYEGGRVLQFGPRDEVYYRPASKPVARFVGVKNFLPGRVEEVTERYTRVAGPGGLTLWGPPGPFAPAQRVECCIRPEHVMLVRKEQAGEPPRPGETRIPGAIVQEVVYGGHVNLLFEPCARAAGVRLPNLHITLPTYMYDRLAVGTVKQWTVALKAEFVHVLPDTA
ncbi:ABC transporter ATP-binding protein [Caldinitratiruptor microaerophilus]|uniref:ABC-type quaternary amine transporter n=1 Tax=Caldinitratiruptor microaerophilus TaxID=671077 RepID=A0AA35G841_9FIRM|nr:ABC transporter ATP-binding protein [Caldinitratiruptor microaerophilus]BDG60033.1 ABC transporter [Caldinitratiruptor microaerophilus]